MPALDPPLHEVAGADTCSSLVMKKGENGNQTIQLLKKIIFFVSHYYTFFLCQIFIIDN